MKSALALAKDLDDRSHWRQRISEYNRSATTYWDSKKAGKSGEILGLVSSACGNWWAKNLAEIKSLRSDCRQAGYIKTQEDASVAMFLKGEVERLWDRLPETFDLDDRRIDSA